MHTFMMLPKEAEGKRKSAEFQIDPLPNSVWVCRRRHPRRGDVSKVRAARTGRRGVAEEPFPCLSSEAIEKGRYYALDGRRLII